MNLRDKKILVVGLGKSGVAAARLLVRQKAKVFVSESKTKSEVQDSLKALPRSVVVETGSNKFLSQDFDLVVLSPGVPLALPALEKFRKEKTPIWSELELGFRFAHPKKIIAITGTNGKTTTTALLGHVLKSAGVPTVVGGNIGTPLCDLVSRIHSKTILVLEVSSYQLEAIDLFHADVGIVMNLTPDHLARHKTMGGYARAKARLFKNSGPRDVAIYKKIDRWCLKIVASTSARKIGFPSGPLTQLAQHVQLPGAHNLENAMAATAAAQAVGLSAAQIKKGLASFEAVPHRIQTVRRLNDVLYVNDSKATNVDSTLVALASFKQKIILILGGEHKGSPYTPLISLIRKKVRQVLTIGEAAPIIEKDLKKSVSVLSCRTLKNAVHMASEMARKNEVVLLSPACASFDQFKNFEHRGQLFIQLVKAL